jgi:hypothetical protein
MERTGKGKKSRGGHVTQASRNTEPTNRDNSEIREIMHDIRELTVPDRATLAVGLIGHLATTMNRSQMTKLLAELQTEAAKVQDGEPARRDDARDAPHGSGEPVHGRQNAGDAVMQAGSSRGDGADRTSRDSGSGVRGSLDRMSDRGNTVGQAGRGEFRSGRLV